MTPLRVSSGQAAVCRLGSPRARRARRAATAAAAAAAVVGVLAGGPALASTTTVWSQQPAADTDEGVPHGLRAISCPSGNTAGEACVAVGENGQIWRTGDDATTWTSSDAGTSQQLNGVHCPTAGTCYAVGSAGTVLATTDGGGSWASQSSGTTQDLNGIDCLTGDTCYAVGDNDTVLHTTDGGTSWDTQSSGSSEHLHGVSCPATDTCYAVGEQATILKTTDGGTNWSTAHGPDDVSGFEKDTHRSVSCPGIDTCYVAGHQPDRSSLTQLPSEGLIRATTTGGDTASEWDKQDANSRTGLLGVDCPSTQDCVATGAGGSVVTTGDGGATSWSQETAATTADLRGVTCPATRECFVAGQGGSKPEVAGTEVGRTYGFVLHNTTDSPTP